MQGSRLNPGVGAKQLSLTIKPRKREAEVQAVAAAVGVEEQRVSRAELMRICEGIETETGS